MSIKNYVEQIGLAPITTAQSFITREFMENYVKAKIAGRILEPVKVASTANLVGTYSAGTFVTTTSIESIDGVVVQDGDRVLLKNQTDSTQNGVYVVTTPETTDGMLHLTRADDFDSASGVHEGTWIPVEEGSLGTGAIWVLVSQDPITIDSTALTFVNLKSMSSDSIRVFTMDITGGTAALSWVATHNFGTRDVLVEIYDKATYETVVVGVTRSSVAEVTISVDAALPSGTDLRALIVG